MIRIVLLVVHYVLQVLDSWNTNSTTYIAPNESMSYSWVFIMCNIRIKFYSNGIYLLLFRLFQLDRFN